MRGKCEFDVCACPKFIDSDHNIGVIRLCRYCGHGKVWHKNIVISRSPSPISFNSSSASAPKQLSPINKIDMNCLICHENRRSVLMLPCRHFVVCKICFESLQNPKECIMCRQTITDSIFDIYI